MAAVAEEALRIEAPLVLGTGLPEMPCVLGRRADPRPGGVEDQPRQIGCSYRLRNSKAAEQEEEEHTPRMLPPQAASHQGILRLTKTNSVWAALAM